MAKFYGDNTLSLPFGPSLQEDQIDKIITTTKKLFEH
jgi:dTDP-4-amino-4,6-dideoxygalactose transaminase